MKYITFSGATFIVHTCNNRSAVSRGFLSSRDAFVTRFRIPDGATGRNAVGNRLKPSDSLNDVVTLDWKISEIYRLHRSWRTEILFREKNALLPSVIET